MALSEQIRTRLAGTERRHLQELAEVLERLSLPVALVELYQAFEGPFGSDEIGFELLDVEGSEPNVHSVTVLCREEYGFPDRLVVLSELYGGAVLVVDTSSDSVYVVDFEGGDELLIAGELEPYWQSSREFLDEFFGC